MRYFVGMAAATNAQEAQMDRRYSIVVDDTEFDPADFNCCNAYNPGGLQKGAVQVACAVAKAFNTDVVIVKHLRAGTRRVGSVTPLDRTLWA